MNAFRIMLADEQFNARCSIVQNYIEQRAMGLQSAVVVNETQFSEPLDMIC